MFWGVFGQFIPSKYTLAAVEDATSGTTTPDTSVDTGDDFNAIPFIAVMAIALAGVVAALFR